MIFGPPAHRVHPRTRTHKTRNHLEPKSVGVPFMEKVRIPKFLVPPGLARTSGPVFFRARAKNQNSAPNILSAPSSSFRNGRTRPRWHKTLGGDRFPVKPIFPGPSPADPALLLMNLYDIKIRQESNPGHWGAEFQRYRRAMETSNNFNV